MYFVIDFKKYLRNKECSLLRAYSAVQRIGCILTSDETVVRNGGEILNLNDALIGLFKKWSNITGIP